MARETPGPIGIIEQILMTLSPVFGRKMWAWIKVVIFGSLTFMYLVWAFDVIPEAAVPIVGWFDDALVLFVAAYFIRGAFRTIMDQGKVFTRPKGVKRRIR